MQPNLAAHISSSLRSGRMRIERFPYSIWLRRNTLGCNEQGGTGRQGQQQLCRAQVATDTADTISSGTAANKRNYRNCSRRSDSLVNGLNAGYYHGSVGITAT